LDFEVIFDENQISPSVLKEIFDKAGQFISTFGRLGDGTGNLSRPKGMAIDQYGHIYVVDALFNNVQIFNEQGKLLLIIGSAVVGPIEPFFKTPPGNPDCVYFTDPLPSHVKMPCVKMLYETIAETCERAMREIGVREQNEGIAMAGENGELVTGPLHKTWRLDGLKVLCIPAPSGMNGIR